MNEHKVVYVFLKTNLLLDLEVIYKDNYNIEYMRVPKETLSTYHFCGLPMFDAIGGVKIVEPAMSVQLYP